MSIRRRVILAVLSITLVALAASWIRSLSSLDTLIHNGGTLRAPGEDPEELTMWSFTSHTLQANHWRGRMAFVSQRYKSMSGAEADMDGWRSRKAWEFSTYPASVVNTPPQPRFTFRSFTDWNVLDLSVSKSSRQGTESFGVMVPHWMACMPVVAFIALVARGSRASRRQRRGACPKCGYDLKGDLTAGCSECGWNRAKPEAKA